MPTETKRTRSERIEVRATPDDRALIDRAVAVSDTDLTSFVMTTLTMAAHRVLADRTEFRLDPDAQAAWDEINSRPARDLAGLRTLIECPVWNSVPNRASVAEDAGGEVEDDGYRVGGSGEA